jgi:hypothetical protein
MSAVARAALSRRTFVVLALALTLLPVASAAAKDGTRAHPYRRGAPVRVDGGFTVRVTSVDRNAWSSIRHQGSAQPAPPPGLRDVLVTMRATNHARTHGIPFLNGTLGAVARSGNTYNSLTETCGTISRDVGSSDPVPPGKTVVVHTCWQVRDFDIKSLVMTYTPYEGSRKLYFALR